MPKKILAVDDDLFILDALTELLKYSGYDVESTPNGDDVFKKIDSYVPDLVLLDVMLAGLDGRDICKKIKSEEKTKNIPVIMVSATPAVNQTIQDYGADDFVAKPFDIFQLLNKIENLLAA
ncbi:response regulator receiver protein [Mucilaginibacter sp. PPCGB 2223]|uniref:response regulator transcription factor n=1 Tax=Mucilaginibacter sp. PPCGB 2223 TaxID=1886027 RepID=UPI0008246130|nr:response regulator transcription factor [Mucilaginibacter sp. PPCGB 2223]OCX53212.1 response regulator receiver protein [Mucilaginibacter sp. PPCGB 2223]